MGPRTRRRLALLPLGALAACAPAAAPVPAPVPAPAGAPAAPSAPAIVPAPREAAFTGQAGLLVDAATPVALDAGAGDDVRRVAAHLLAILGAPAGTAPRTLAPGEAVPTRAIHLTLAPDNAGGPTGYEVTVATDRATVAAATAEGLFHGVQTLRQLLPYAVEHRGALSRRLALPVGRVVDAPRFAWRGLMLDVARHFLPADDVKRFVDAMALYKLNRLHLHLADDQGWRLEIRSWPNLARHGGRTQVGGGPGGFYTQAEFADLVAYAAERHVVIVPEIDLPGHTNAALASYPELNCDGVAPPLYTGTRVGFSTVCVDRDTVYRFVDDVVREIGALAPGPWFHAGGDEVEKLTDAQYRAFVERVQAIVRRHGKTMVGWSEIAPAALHPETVVQHWRADSAALAALAAHAARGGRVVLSPAERVYLDMKYDSSTALGLQWAGIVSVRHAYDWEPAALLPGVPEGAILGVEGALWAETVERRSEYEQLAFPRLLAVAELGWSAPARRDWADFRRRLAAHGPRLAALGINFHRAAGVDW